MFEKLSPPILSSELNVKLGHVRNPEEIAGSVHLDPVDKLSDYFLSPPDKHIHIVVQLPDSCEYSRGLSILPSLLNNVRCRSQFPHLTSDRVMTVNLIPQEMPSEHPQNRWVSHYLPNERCITRSIATMSARKETVAALYNKLNAYRFIQVSYAL